MRTVRRLAAVVAAAMAVVVSVAAGGSAVASSPPVQAGLTINPATTTVGAGVTVVATATNTTSAAVAASMGVDVPSGLTVSGVSGTAGCHPRNLTRLVYCGVQSLPPQATATITFTATPTTTGTDNFRSYARITYTTDDSFAYATLTVT